MAKSEFEVVVVGGGAAGIAAARVLHDAGVDCLIVEARERLGGRAWTVSEAAKKTPIDLGCGWLHSADRNPWREIAEAQGRTIDKTPPPWMRPVIDVNFPEPDQKGYFEAVRAFWTRVGDFPETGADVPASSLLEPKNRWNGLIGAVGTYLSGAELSKLSARDFSRYEDTGVNFRVVEGYGATIVDHAHGLPVKLGCAVRAIDHSGKRIRIETGEGTITADAAIVTLPSALIAEEAIRFTPALPEKVEAAAGLPLGLADKVFFSLDRPEEFESDSRLFARTDRSNIGSYHFRPFGRPQIEGYFGGALAADLEAAGDDALVDFALGELTAVLGSAFAKRVKPIGTHRWKADEFARGSYSYAVPGKADCRVVLAAPVDGRIFFAGEACSRGDYSTAHGAYLTGIAAADQAIAALGKRPELAIAPSH
jgi:monoamine oxidase